MNIYDYFVYLVKLKPFAVEAGYYCYIKICIYNLQSCYQTSRQNKKKQKMDVMKTLILLFLLTSRHKSQNSVALVIISFHYLIIIGMSYMVGIKMSGNCVGEML